MKKIIINKAKTKWFKNKLVLIYSSYFICTLSLIMMIISIYNKRTTEDGIIFFCIFIIFLFISINLKYSYLIEKNKNQITNITKSISLEQITKLDFLIKEIEKHKGIPYYQIKVLKNSNIDIFDSKLGGIPYWDPNKEYPKGLYLLAQINFDKEKFDNELLPKTGMLQFFIEANDDLGLNFEKGFDVQDKWRVIYHKKINYSIKRNDLDKMNLPSNINLEKDIFPFENELKLEFVKGIDFSGLYYYNADKQLCEILNKINYSDKIDSDFLNNFSDEEQKYLYNKLNSFDHKLLGYPAFTQEDPRFNNSKYEEYNTLLFQLDSKDGIMWGDAGVCKFFINKENLKKKDFSKILYKWDCY